METFACGPDSGDKVFVACKFGPTRWRCSADQVDRVLTSTPPRPGCAAVEPVEYVCEFAVPRPMEICSEVGDSGKRFRDLADDVELMERTHRSEDNDLRLTVFVEAKNVQAGTRPCRRMRPCRQGAPAIEAVMDGRRGYR
jgi:hypothetical protein